MEFKLESKFKPAGDQPKAIEGLVSGLKKDMRYQTLMGVTGSGKTFVMGQVIQKVQRPTLIIAHNKTLAAQLASEFRALFPHNAVEYFVSYYDYYQPEAYMPGSDTYIEKEAMINEEIDRLRHNATQSLLTRRDVIVVSSVSCIYNIGSPEEYRRGALTFSIGQIITRGEIMRALVEMQYERTNADVLRGQFRVRGDVVEIHPPQSSSFLYRIDVSSQKVCAIEVIDPVTRKVLEKTETLQVFPTKHYVASETTRESALLTIKKEMMERVKYFQEKGLPLEAERIERRTKSDIEMIRQLGFCHGIENYSRYFDGRKPGEPPFSLISYFPKDFVTIIDESHVTIPQIGGMFFGDQARKKTLVDYGFRLPSAIDNRPLKFEEFEERIGQTILVSATPSSFERKESDAIVEMIVRPTGLVDPEIILRPINGQIDDLLVRIADRIAHKERVLVTTLTKKMAEDLTEYLNAEGAKKKPKMKAVYVHSDVDTIDRIKILASFRRGDYDVLVGVNLLREGLDLPEVSLVAILDADKEGFLRSDTALIQTIGRAARNVRGQVILYADNVTGSMKRAIDETSRRREIQVAYNKENNITPQTIKKRIVDFAAEFGLSEDPKGKLTKIKDTLALEMIGDKNKPIGELIKEKEAAMKYAASELQFEIAAVLRDEIKELRKKLPPTRENRKG